MVRFLIILFLALATIPTLQAQDAAPRQQGIRIYNLFRTTTDYSFVDSTHILDENVDYLHPTVAYFWASKKRNVSFEAELTSLDFKRRERSTASVDSAELGVGAESIRTAELAGRFEAILPLRWLQSERFKTSIGFSGALAYYSVRNEPPVTTLFTTSRNTGEFNLHVTPRITYWFTQRLCVDLNIPVSLARLSYRVDRLWDPSIVPICQKTTNLSYEAFAPEFSARLGVGIRL